MFKNLSVLLGGDMKRLVVSVKTPQKETRVYKTQNKHKGEKFGYSWFYPQEPSGKRKPAAYNNVREKLRHPASHYQVAPQRPVKIPGNVHARDGEECDP